MNYNVARITLTLLSLLGWAVVLIGILLFFVEFSESNDFISALIIGGGAAAFGFIYVVISQMGLAHIDTAENTGEMRRLLHQYLDNTGSRPTHQTPTAPIRPAVVSTSQDGVVKVYKGYPIRKAPDWSTTGEFLVGDTKVKGLIAAEKEVDRIVAENG